MANNNAQMGANLTHGGAEFRVWAPNANQVDLICSSNGWVNIPLERQNDGYWYVFLPGVREGDQYKYFIVGKGSTGHKRDPYGRARTWGQRDLNNIVTHPTTFPWHDAGYSPPKFNDLIIYQLHVGAFFSTDANGNDMRRTRPGRYLDLLYKIEYLVELGVSAVQLLPIQEFETMRSLGYNGTDYYSPEIDYTVVPLDPEFQRYFNKANELLATKGLAPFQPGDLDCQTKQLMALVDLCHCYGLAVIFDVVYNHAGGEFNGESIRFFDRQPYDNLNNSLFFTDKEWAGGMIFAYWQNPVCQYLIDNAKFFFNEYHVDGFRFDEVTVIDRFGGWAFLQNLTDTLRYLKPGAALIAEYWADQSSVLRSRSNGGAGFDSVVDSGMRNTVRGCLEQAAAGKEAQVNLDPVAGQLYPKFGSAWRSVHHLENHDINRINNDNDRKPRIAALADSTNSRSWYARSRARWANGLLLTAPGAPMLFMGQEFMEDKFWSDSPDYYSSSLIWWNGLETDRVMQDHLRFIRELISLRYAQPALRSDAIRVFHVHNDNRVLAFHRWVPGEGRDVIVVASLREETWWGYDLGFPHSGEWREVFNSDVYDGWVNPNTAGNGGRVYAGNTPLHDFSASARIVIPANGIVVFAAS